MPKKVLLVLVVIIFLTSFRVVGASLVINEVMYDLSGSDSVSSKSGEWIEIYNPDSSDVSVDASTWRIYDGGANRTINGEVNFSIPAGAYIILAGDKDTFLSDHAGFSGTVYDTGITTLNNTGATLKILNQDGITVDSFSYTSSLGGAGDGNTLQKISGSWFGAGPTPGVTNESGSPTPPTSSSGEEIATSGSGGGTSGNIYNNSSSKIQNIKTKITAKTLIFKGIPAEFKADTFGHYGEVMSYGKYYWNFGDGDFKEMKINEVDKFSHTYFYPGEYTVPLEYYLSYNSSEPDAIDRITVKVIDPGVVISNVGDEKGFFVELSNNTNYVADISKWILWSDRINFVLPKNTTLGANKKMIIPPYISNFSVEDKNSLKLMTPQMEVVHDYNISSPVKKSFSTSGQKITAEQKIISENQSLPENFTNENEKSEILGENFGANAIFGENNFLRSVPVIVFVVFLVLTSGFVYFIRQKRASNMPGDDYELLDE